jgi:hypothetical protein
MWLLSVVSKGIVMNHLALIQDEFLKIAKDKIAIDPDWWKKLTPEQQREYISTHRKTKLRPLSRPTMSNKELLKKQHPAIDEQQIQDRTTRRILAQTPKNWKQTLLYNGMGEGSETVQLSDALRPRQIKEAFEDTTVIAVVGFEGGRPITDMKPAFFMKRSGYKDDRFNCEVPELQNGNVVKNQKGEIAVKTIAEETTKWRGGSRFRPAHSYVDRKSDLRMSKIIEMMPDKPYTIFAVKLDPKRIEAKQMRSALKDTSKVREVEKKIVANAAKPIYDFYSDELQSNIAVIQKASIPSFNDVLDDKSNSRQERDAIELAFHKVQNARSKLSSLSSAIHSIYWNHLPRAGEQLIDPKHSDSSKQEVKRFLEKVTELKKQFANEYYSIIRDRCYDVTRQLTNKQFDDAVDVVKDLNLKKAIPMIDNLRTVSDPTTFTNGVVAVRQKMLEEAKKYLPESQQQ